MSPSREMQATRSAGRTALKEPMLAIIPEETRSDQPSPGLRRARRSAPSAPVKARTMPAMAS